MTTNTVATLMLLTIVATNWVRFSGDMKRESGTNFVHEWQQVVTNVYVVRPIPCPLCGAPWHTNSLLMRLERPQSNSISQWVHLVGPNPPALPGQFEKQ